MSQELETFNPSSPVASPSSMAVSLTDLEQQANAMGAAMRIAEAMCSTELVPKQYRGKPADGAAAIMYGAELGLNATQSLQQVMVINGKPGIEARTAMGLLIRQGYLVETLESSAQCVSVRITGPRGNSETATWDIERAERAGYLKNALYKSIPEQMLYAKAAMEAARKIAPHVLMGIAYSTEELQLSPLNATAERTDRPSGVAALRGAVQRQEPPQEELPAPEYSPIVAELISAIEGFTDFESVKTLMTSIPNAELSESEFQQVRKAANTKCDQNGWR